MGNLDYRIAFHINCPSKFITGKCFAVARIKIK